MNHVSLNKLVLNFLLIFNVSAFAVDKVIDGSGGTDALIINPPGISNLGDFAISESGDYIVLTSANGDTISFKNIQSLTVGSIAYTATGTSSNGYNIVNLSLIHI